SEHTNKVNTLQRRAPSWGVYRRQYTYWSEQVISQQQQDRDSEESDACMDIQARYAPCELLSHHQRSSFQKQDQMHIYMEAKQKPPEKKMGRNRQDETLGSWFKIIIPFGIKYDEKWLLNLIQKKCSVPFTAFEFHYEKMQAQFFVENASIACALKNVNGKIFNEVNEKIFILVEPCGSPQSVQKPLTSEEVQIKFSSLDLSNKKPYLLDGLSTIMGNASNIQNLNISNTEVKAEGQMDKGQQLEPEGMCADRNAMCANFPDKSTNINTILELLPRLLSLGSFFGSDQVNSKILQFLQQYYLIHDYGNRQGLLDFYHEEACFFLTIPFHPKYSDLSSVSLYFKDNRNTETLKNPNLRVQMLKHTKRDIVHALCVLPKTQHDFSSFTVDMCFQTEMIFCFSVSGVFKEVEGSSQGCVRAFTRTFITAPTSSSSLCIVNDELFVREASPSEAQRLHSPSQCLHCRPRSCSTSPLSCRKCAELRDISNGILQIIPFGIKYDQKWLLNLIQKKCSVPFTAFEFHYEKMQAQFFVEDANIACALKNVNGKIFNEVNEKILILVEPCESPQSVQKALTSEKLEQTKLSSLYLSNKKPYLVHSLSTIMENAPTTEKLNLSNTEVGGQETLSDSVCAIEAPKCLPMCKKQRVPVPGQQECGEAQNPNLHIQILKHTKRDIVHALCALPKTQHDFSSFMVDMHFQTVSTCSSLGGEGQDGAVEGSSQGCVRAFTRTFITAPTSSSSLCIVNDELFVREASPSEAQRLHSPSQCQPPSWSSSPPSSR
ncbi:nuclear RNA export factor 3-like, partial [Moschus berezovskii]|uniref:nuclear RNA export factor 3-like n=1 Tax=Moschus berezovskii TaxID=68408 RepID=UPI002444E297